MENKEKLSKCCEAEIAYGKPSGLSEYSGPYCSNCRVPTPAEEKEECKDCEKGPYGERCWSCVKKDYPSPSSDSMEERFEEKFIVKDRAGRKRFITMNELSLADNILAFIKSEKALSEREAREGIARELRPILEAELKTMYRMIGMIQPKSEAEFIAVALPNLHTGLFHFINLTNTRD